MKAAITAPRPRRAAEPTIKVFGDRFWNKDSPPRTKQQKKRSSEASSPAGRLPCWSQFRKSQLDTNEIQRRDDALFADPYDFELDDRVALACGHGASQIKTLSLISLPEASDQVMVRYNALRRQKQEDLDAEGLDLPSFISTSR